MYNIKQRFHFCPSKKLNIFCFLDPLPQHTIYTLHTKLYIFSAIQFLTSLGILLFLGIHIESIMLPPAGNWTPNLFLPPRCMECNPSPAAENHLLRQSLAASYPCWQLFLPSDSHFLLLTATFPCWQPPFTADSYFSPSDSFFTLLTATFPRLTAS